ncbi:MAG: Sec-independent protein translocase protein TatB [Pyrinomonadaceae bacterium]
MFLFIFESIGTSELMLIGIIALIFLGPRKLPDMARKAGKIMSEFRGTANEFKETWQREVNFEEEVKLMNIDDLDAETNAPAISESVLGQPDAPAAPKIKEIDPARLDELKASDNGAKTEESTDMVDSQTSPATTDKQNWL